jgi:DNA replication protein DnaC
MTEGTAEVFDKIVASAQQAILDRSKIKPFGSVPLRLHREPIVRWMPGVRRSIGEIDPDLRATFRRLVTGDACWPLFLYGRPGTGKTCAGLCLCDYAFGRYWTVDELCQEVIESQQGRLLVAGQTADVILPAEFWRRAGNWPLVVLDEIGTRESVTPHHYECVKKILDIRVEREKPTVLISNLSLDAINKIYDGRVLSRSGRGTYAELKGPDRRLS